MAYGQANNMFIFGKGNILVFICVVAGSVEVYASPILCNIINQSIEWQIFCPITEREITKISHTGTGTWYLELEPKR